jgi:hypothetical protein
MIELFRRIGRTTIAALLAAAFVLIGSAVPAAEGPKYQSLWFDPTQLPQFIGVVDRYLPNPDGRIDRVIFKQGPQIVFPPDAFDAVREVAPPGRSLVVWGIRARNAPVITMLAFGAPEGEATVLDRFYWRPERSGGRGRRELMLTGKVWAPYLSPQGQPEGAILDNGDVIRIDPNVAALFKDRLTEGARITAGGPGSETALGRAIDAERIGESAATLVAVPPPEPGRPGGKGAGR